MPLAIPRALYAQAATTNKRLLIIAGAGHTDVLYKGEQRLFTQLDSLLAPTDQTNEASSQLH
jgi:hypothetical protein